jgi:hypothetical protein
MQFRMPSVSMPNVKKAVAAAGLGLSIVGSPMTATAGQPKDFTKELRSIENIARVKYSLKYVDEDINKGSVEVANIVAQIKALLNNYKLKENVNSSLKVVAKDKREEARQHGVQAVEDLAIIYEYFYDRQDSLSLATVGKDTGFNDEKPVVQLKDLLTFALNALKATDKELADLLALYPSELREKAMATVAAEYQ